MGHTIENPFSGLAGLASRCNRLGPLGPCVRLCRLPGRYRHLLLMSPDPSAASASPMVDTTR